MKSLMEKLGTLDQGNADERLIYQAMDLLNIKYNGIQRLALDEPTERLVDALVMDWFWMCDKGYSLSRDPRSQMDESDLARYDEMFARFGEFQSFMLSNMRLKDSVTRAATKKAEKREFLNEYLVITSIDHEQSPSIKTAGEIIKLIEMQDCFEAEYQVFGISEGTPIALEIHGKWHTARDPLYIKITDAAGNIIFDGYGEEH